MQALVIGLLGVLAAGLSLVAQTPAGRFPATYRSAAQIAAELEKSSSPAGLVGGQAVAIVPGMVLRRRMAGPNNASVHSAETDKQDVTEIYEIVEGSGTFVTGGTFADPRDRTAGIKGGESRRVSKGDFIVIPWGPITGSAASTARSRTSRRACQRRRRTDPVIVNLSRPVRGSDPGDGS